MNLWKKIQGVRAVLKLKGQIMSEVGDLNQSRMAAKWANEKAPDGVALVVPAKPPVSAANASTATTFGAGITGATVTGVLYLVAPHASPETLGAVGTLVALAANWTFQWLRKRAELKSTPGVGPVAGS